MQVSIRTLRSRVRGLFKDVRGNRFSTFFRERGAINEQQFELSYVNNILPEFRKLIESSVFKWESKDWSQFVPEPAYKVVQYIFNFEKPPLSLQVTSRPAVETTTQSEVLAFQLDARSTTVKISMDEWFARAHEVIERAFEDLLTPETLELWRRTAR